MVKLIKKVVARLVIKLSPLRWAERQLPNNNFSEKLEANREAIYKAMKEAMADRGEG